MDHFQKTILNVISKNGPETGLRACNIVTIMAEYGVNTERKTVNRNLYQLFAKRQVFRTQSDKGVRWSITSGENIIPSERIVVIVDLGNTHDCLPELDTYDYGVETWAYADRAYNGYGVRTPLNKPDIRFYQASDTNKNAADIQLVWDLCKDCQSAGKTTYIIATKDQGFNSVKTIVERDTQSTVEFVVNWEELRMCIE